MGGVEMETGVLFADVRGFTSLAEKMAPDDVAQVLNRFYGCATEILTRSAIVDKLVGDEVMALYFPMLLGERWEGKMVDDARDLLTAVGYGADGEPWLRLGVGLDVGRAYVGNVARMYAMASARFLPSKNSGGSLAMMASVLLWLMKRIVRTSAFTRCCTVPGCFCA